MKASPPDVAASTNRLAAWMDEGGKGRGSAAILKALSFRDEPPLHVGLCICGAFVCLSRAHSPWRLPRALPGFQTRAPAACSSSLCLQIACWTEQRQGPAAIHGGLKAFILRAARLMTPRALIDPVLPSLMHWGKGGPRVQGCVPAKRWAAAEMGCRMGPQ